VTNEIQQTRYDRLMRRVGGIIGPGSKVSEVLTELFPTLDVESVPGELLFLTGWQLGFGGGSITPGAGDVQKFQVVNPADSGKLVVVTRAIITGTANTSYSMNVTATLFVSAPGTETKRDTREGVGQTVAQVREESSAVLTSPNFVMLRGTRAPMDLQDNNGLAVLSPGFAFEIGNNTGAQQTAVGFFWRERTAELSELAFS